MLWFRISCGIVLITMGFMTRHTPELVSSLTYKSSGDYLVYAYAIEQNAGSLILRTHSGESYRAFGHLPGGVKDYAKLRVRLTGKTLQVLGVERN